MFKIPVDASRLGVFVIESIEPVLDFETKQPKTNDEGQVQHKVICRYMEDSTSKPQDFVMKMWLSKTPDFVPYTQVAFDGVEALYWETNGRSGVSFTAAKMMKPRS